MSRDTDHNKHRVSSELLQFFFIISKHYCYFDLIVFN